MVGVVVVSYHSPERTARFVSEELPKLPWSYRACVVDVGEGLIELVNPEIVSSEGEVTVIEGCLSVPDRAGRVVRPEKVKVKAQDRHGEPFEIEGEGMLAVCLCHEIDHLDGILYTDKMIEDATEEMRRRREGEAK